MTEGDVGRKSKKALMLRRISRKKTIEESAESHEGHDSDSSETE
jgi:hypothetical protein